MSGGDFTQQARKIAIAIAVVTLISLIAVIFGMPSVSVHNVGTIKTIGVQCDTTSINWGMVDPGGSTNYTVHIRNPGTAPVTLTFSTSNWNPTAAGSYMTLLWNYTGNQITSAWVPTRFTLAVSQTIQNITTFSFDITITGTG